MRSVTMGPRGWGIAAVVAVLLALGLYLGGRWQERSRADATHEEMAAQIAALAGERDRARAELASAQERIALLGTRSLLFETALDLERRNFGIANQHLDAAAEQLAAVGGPAAGIDAGAIRELQRDIAEADLTVATNLQTQRGQVLEFISRLDQLIPSQRGIANE